MLAVPWPSSADVRAAVFAGGRRVSGCGRPKTAVGWFREVQGRPQFGLLLDGPDAEPGVGHVGNLWMGTVFVGALELDVLLGDVHSLKQKRSVVRPVVAELRRRFEVAAAEAGHLDLHRRALLGVSVVASDAGHVLDVLDSCERLVAARPELELLSTRRRMIGPED